MLVLMPVLCIHFSLFDLCASVCLAVMSISSFYVLCQNNKRRTGMTKDIFGQSMKQFNNQKFF